MSRARRRFEYEVHNIGFGILFGILLAVPLGALVRRPEAKHSAFFQIVAVDIAALLAAVISADSSYVVAAAVVGVMAAILLALHPARRRDAPPTAATRPSAGRGRVRGSGAARLVHVLDGQAAGRRPRLRPARQHESLGEHVDDGTRARARRARRAGAAVWE